MGDVATSTAAAVGSAAAPGFADGATLVGNSSIGYGNDVPPSRRDSVRRRGLALADVVGLLAGWVTVLVALTPQVGGNGWWLAAGLPLWVLLNKLLGLYDRDATVINKSTLDELPRLVQSVTLGALLCYTFAEPVLGSEFAFTRGQTALFWVSGLGSMFAFRAVARRLVRLRFAPERTLIVGSGVVAGIVARKLAAHPECGVELVGFVDAEHDLPGALDGELPLLGSMDDFERICRETEVERVVIAFSATSHEALLDVIRTSKRARIKITIVPRLFEVLGHRFEVDEIEGMTLLGLRGLARARSSLLLKRSIDIAGATAMLVLASPLLLALALAVKLSSRGPVLYAQRRVGRNNEPFTMYKFRTMVVGADRMKPQLAHLNECDDVLFKIADDPRITPFGRMLRRTSLDELPQLLNVLRGEMSLVGPRPLIPAENAHVIGWHRARLDLTPGLTGPWQVMGRTAIPFQEMVKMDYLYVAEWSLWNDIRLLMRTLPVVLFGRGQ